MGQRPIWVKKLFARTACTRSEGGGSVIGLCSMERRGLGQRPILIKGVEAMEKQVKVERHRRFWQPLQRGEGGYLAVLSPMGNTPVAPPQPSSLEEQWLSVDYRMKVMESSIANTCYGLDAIHNQFVNFGPGVHAALLGAPYQLTKDSIWFGAEPIIKDWDTPVTLKTNTNHELYKEIENHTRTFCAASKGRYFVSATDIGGQYDVLYSLRGEELLIDMLEYPNEVMAAEENLNREFVEYFNTLCKIIGDANCGYTGWMPIVSDTPWYPIQCDMSVMISPKMFEKFVLPSLDWVSTQIGQTIYHLDGAEQIQHLDMLLSLKHIHAIQWTMSSKRDDVNKGEYTNYDDEMSIDIYKRTIAAGKKVVLIGVNPAQVANIYNRVGTSDGIFILTYCPTRKQADALIDHATKNWVKL